MHFKHSIGAVCSVGTLWAWRQPKMFWFQEFEQRVMKGRINVLVRFLIFRLVPVTSKADHTANIMLIETD